jgi:hypothetical protein
MANKRHGCFYYLFGGWIFEIMKWIFILAFWPISLIVWLVRNHQQKQTRTYTVKVNHQNYGGGNFDAQKFRLESEANMTKHYMNQLGESLRIINDTNNIATLFSRLSFLDQLRYNVVTNNSDLDLSGVVEAIDEERFRKEEYINLFILRRIASLENQCENSSPTTTSNKFKQLYNQFELHRDKMSELNISTYTNLCQMHIQGV